MTNLGFFKWAKENGIVVSTVPQDRFGICIGANDIR